MELATDEEKMYMEEALKEEYDGAYEIRYVDVDANQDLVDTYNVGGTRHCPEP